jgi:hypothetical protein
MTAEEFKWLLSRVPFVPFRIHRSDGKIFDVSRSDQVLLTRTTAPAPPAKPGSIRPWRWPRLTFTLTEAELELLEQAIDQAELRSICGRRSESYLAKTGRVRAIIRTSEPKLLSFVLAPL